MRPRVRAYVADCRVRSPRQLDPACNRDRGRGARCPARLASPGTPGSPGRPSPRLAAAPGAPLRPPRTDGQEGPSGAHLEAAALAYIRRGWPVFVLGRSKRPVANCQACRAAGPEHDRAGCACLTCHGFYAATTDPARLAAMLAQIPGGLLAIRTGRVAGLCVVDIDPRNGGQIDRDADDARPPPSPPAAAAGTCTTATPAAPPSPPCPAAAGVDIKGDGGYVAAPPSVHPGTGQPYRWARRRGVAEMPPALRAALTPPPAAPAPPLSGPVTARAAGGISSPAALLAAHLRAVQNAPEGRRRVTLYGAARGVARMVTAGAITGRRRPRRPHRRRDRRPANPPGHPRRDQRRFHRRRSRRMTTPTPPSRSTAPPSSDQLHAA